MSNFAVRVRELLGENGTFYFSLLLLAAPLSILGNQFPDFTLIFGQNLAISLPLVASAVAFVAWLFYRPVTCSNKSLGIFLTLFGVYWAIIYFLSVSDSQQMNYLVFLVPLTLALTWFKPPKWTEIRVSGDIVSWILIAITLMWEVLNRFIEDPDRINFGVRWSWIGDTFGITNRWYGPFEYPSYAGIVGAYLLVWGATRVGFRRFSFALVGLFILVMSAAYTSLLSALAGLLCIFIFNGLNIPLVRHFNLRVRVFFSLTLATMAFGSLFLLNPTMSGRTPLYQVFLDMWVSSPVRGVGTSGVTTAMEQGILHGGLTNGHNLFIDSLGRHGFLGTFPLILVLLSATVLSIGAAKRGVVAGAAIVTTFMVIALTEDQGKGLYWSIPFTFLFIGTMLSGRYLQHIADGKVSVDDANSS